MGNKITQDEIRSLIKKHLELGEVNKLSRQSYADDDRISGTLLTAIEKLIQAVLNYV